MNSLIKTLITIIVMLNASLAGDGTWSGVVFYEFALEESGYESGEFEINRAYLTYQQKMTDNLKVKIQTDVGRQKNDSSNPHLMVYLKNARLDWKTDFGTFIFGLQGMNMFSVQEKTWGFRFIEKSAMDKNKWSSSADLGIGYSFKLFDTLKGTALLTNGSGYKAPEDDDHKKLSVQLFTGENKLSSKEGYNLGGVFTFENYDIDSVTVGFKTVAGAFGGWSNSRIRAGVEYNVMVDSDESDNATLVSAYGNYKVNEKLRIFGRYDLAGDGDESTGYIIFGLNIKPAKGLSIAPNMRVQPDDSEAVYALNIQFKF